MIKLDRKRKQETDRTNLLATGMVEAEAFLQLINHLEAIRRQCLNEQDQNNFADYMQPFTHEMKNKGFHEAWKTLNAVNVALRDFENGVSSKTYNKINHAKVIKRFFEITRNNPTIK